MPTAVIYPFFTSYQICTYKKYIMHNMHVIIVTVVCYVIILCIIIDVSAMLFGVFMKFKNFNRVRVLTITSADFCVQNSGLLVTACRPDITALVEWA